MNKKATKYILLIIGVIILYFLGPILLVVVGVGVLAWGGFLLWIYFKTKKIVQKTDSENYNDDISYSEPRFKNTADIIDAEYKEEEV